MLLRIKKLGLWVGIALWSIFVLLQYVQQMYIADVECAKTAHLSNAPCFFSDVYFTLFALLFLLPALLLPWRKKCRAAYVALAIGFGALYMAQIDSLKAVSDVRSYGYERFYMVFYAWQALLYALFAAALWARPGQLKKWLGASLIITCICTLLFTFYGRGSVDHITVVIGGILGDLRLVYLSDIVQSWLVFALAGLGMVCMRIAPMWVKHARIDWLYIHHVKRITLSFLGISACAMLSAPLGMIVNHFDVRDAKEYIAATKEPLEEYWRENDKYPPDLYPFILEKETVEPLLLDIFSYLAFNTKGAYYYSREQKYCFIIFNPGYPFGYHSLTNRRDWQFHPYQGQPLEFVHKEYCDEPQTFRDKMGTQMGIKEDPVTGAIKEPDYIFKQNWETPNLEKFPEFRATEQDKQGTLEQLKQ